MNQATQVPIVSLRGALARIDRRSNLPPLDLELGAGVHAVVGRPEDGTIAVARLVGGFEPNVIGKVIVAGRDPSRDPSLRAHIGVTLERPRLPPTGRVRDYLNHVGSVRGDTPGLEQALHAFGLSQWAGRKMTALSHHEARALELVVAASTPEPFALAFTEPGADIAPFDRQALRDALFRAADGGACVMVLTASTSDAMDLSNTLQILERGRITRWVPVDESGALVPGRGIALRIEVDFPRLLVAALADDPAIGGLDWSPEGHRDVLAVRGDDIDQVALAVARAAVASGVNVRTIAPTAPAIEEVRAAASGLALAAYHAAYGAYYAHHGRQAAGDPGPDPSAAPARFSSVPPGPKREPP